MWTPKIAIGICWTSGQVQYQVDASNISQTVTLFSIGSENLISTTFDLYGKATASVANFYPAEEEKKEKEK